VKARADAERAIELAPELGEAHAALGETLEYGFFDFAGAESSFQRAIELAPANPRVLRAYSRFTGYMGHADRAIAAGRKNVALDPFSIPAHFSLGEAFMAARNYPEALVEFDEAIKLNPGHASEAYQRRGRTLYLLGRYADAAASCEAEPDRYESQLCLPLVYAKLGQQQRAQDVLTTAIAEQGEYSSYQFVEIYAQWGDAASALKWLDTAVRTRDPGLEYLKTDELLDPLRNDPTFVAIERAMRYPL
jgi:tetratricopeptide (TPR) repeat protein